MNIIPLILLFILTSFNLEDKVYICDSTTAKRYHYNRSCRGLNACTHDIIDITREEAINNYGRTLCGWED